jgi:tungstate transport system ATP-binding protein
MPELVLDDTAYEIDETMLFGPTDLRYDRPGITAVLGPNGAGKSLFLSLCQGMIRPTSGSLRWDGTAAHLARGTRGIVFQTPTIMRRSVFDNVAFALRAADKPRSDLRARVMSVLERVNLAVKAQVPAAALSGGEGQRMALARAIINNPDVLLLDEPSSNLDPASTRQLENIVRSVADEGVNVFLATHDIGQAKRLAQNILFMDKGHFTDVAEATNFFAGPTSEPAEKYLKGIL